MYGTHSLCVSHVHTLVYSKYGYDFYIVFAMTFMKQSAYM